MALGLALATPTVQAQPAAKGTSAPSDKQSGGVGGLGGVLQAAVQNHPSVRKTIADREASVAGVDEARAHYLPTLSGQTNQGADPNVTWGLIRLQQPIWAGGKIDAGVDVAESKLSSSEWAVLESRRQLMEQATAAYVAVIGNKALLATAQDGVNAHEKLLDLIRRRREGGVASDADIRLAEARLASVRTQAKDLAGQVRRQELELSILTAGHAKADAPLPSLYMNWEAPQELLTQAREASPLIRRKRQDVVTVTHETEVHQGERWPVISLRVDSDVGPTPTVYNQPRTRAGIYAEANVDGGGFVGYQRIKADAARLLAAQEDVAAASFEVDRRVQIMLNDRDLATQQLGDHQVVVQTQEMSLESSLRLYDAGRKNWVDVLNAQRELLDARLNRDRAKMTANDAELRIAVMCGTLDALAGLE
ncbi:MAG: TolC family protein [Leptothrix ochracea]|uniref:TolC family protein n=1 Tax=Leptothrix ochracea TaxID=735331 RepID=UPI0034E2BEFE